MQEYVNKKKIVHLIVVGNCIQTINTPLSLLQKLAFNNGMTSVLFSLFVTGSHRYDSVRPLSYADADLIMICFSVAEPESMDHAISRVSDAIYDVIFIFH